MQTSTPIAVLGAGSWGTALAILLARNGEEVRLWGYHPDHVDQMLQQRENPKYLPGIIFPDNLTLNKSLEQTLEDVQDILIVVPSHAFRATINSLSPLINAQHRIVWGTKGLDAQSDQLLDQVVREIIQPEIPLAVLAGPSFAKEVANNLPTAITLASQDEQFSQDLIKRFHYGVFRVYRSTDIVGTEIAGVVKNVLAIAAGISDGLGYGANARSALITRGLVEMIRLGLAMGGQKETFYGLAGMGDLILTCTDNLSRNRRFGLALGKGESIAAAKTSVGQVIEGADNVVQVYNLALSHNIDMPITKAVYSVLQKGTAPADAVNNLLAREPKRE